MRVLDGGPLVLPIRVQRVGACPEWPRSVQRDEGDDVLEPVGSQVPHERPHPGALHLEDPHRIPAREHRVDLGIVERDRIDVGADAGGRLDQLEGALDRGEVAKTEEVHLQQAQALDAVHLELGDDLGVLALLLDRDDVEQRLR